MSVTKFWSYDLPKQLLCVGYIKGGTRETVIYYNANDPRK